MSEKNVTFQQGDPNVLSVVVPVFNEAEVISETARVIEAILFENNIPSEMVIVDDGSTDDTLKICKNLTLRIPIRLIKIEGNHGHMTALRSGMEAASGRYILTIDADLQDPPSYIPQMYSLIRTSEYDVIQTYRQDRKSDSIFKRKAAHYYYRFISRIAGVNVIPQAADYRVITQDVAKKLLNLPEKKLVFRLLIPNLGFRIKLLPITREQRFAGKSKYTIRKMASLAIDSIISFTYRPLRLLAYVGFLSSAILFLGSLGTLFLYLSGSTLPGWPSLALLVLSGNAFVFAGLGLLGEYIGRIFQLLQARPSIQWSELHVNEGSVDNDYNETGIN